MNREHRRDPMRPVTAAATGATAAAMILTPLARRGGRTRRWCSAAVVTGLATTTATRTWRRWGPRRTAATAGVITLGTLAVERIGVRTGWPFGRYRYTASLRPQIGGVPVIVPMAWFAMAIPARETADAFVGHRTTPARRIVLGAAALTAWDLFLDPQMVGEGYWRWHRRGRYRGIPARNFLGWFVTGLAVMALAEALLPPEERRGDDHRPDGVLIGEYTAMAAMETLGFAVFFRDRVVALAGGAAMLPLAVEAVRRSWDWRHWRHATVR